MNTATTMQAIDEALSACESEQIHLLGNIQAQGVLIACEGDQFLVRAASANLDSLFARTARSALGQPLEALLGAEQMAQVRHLVGMGISTDIHARSGSLLLPQDGQLRRHDMQIFMSERLVVLEIEFAQASTIDVFQDLFLPVRDALWKLDAENDLNRYAQMAVEQVRLLTGYDRVMMYRFDNNWDGEVIAESRVEKADSYLGNRFPASDIPPQARALYTRNLVRTIADVDAEQVPILTTGAQDGSPGAPVTVDLSHSWLRSMSPVHVEYLRNMGVRASLSISLVQNNRLWGLIACHHLSPKYVSLRARDLDEFIARVVSLKLINMDTQERAVMAARIRELLAEMTESIRSSENLDSIIHLLKDKLLSLVRSEGVLFTIDSERHAIGITPPEEVIVRIEATLRQRSVSPVFCTDDLHTQLDGLAEPADKTLGASGIMVAPLDRRMDNYVMWFRPAILRTLRWAGNPEKTLVRDERGLRVSPRKSFATWIEQYRGKSEPWSQVEADAASSLSLAIIEVLAHKALKSSEESYRLLAENSTDMIARLDLDGIFQFATPSCLELFGLSSEHIVGHALGRVIDNDPLELPQILRLLQPLGATSTTMLHKTRPGQGDVWIEAYFKHSIGMSGQHELLLNARNVTQRYNYQLAIEEVHRRHTKVLEAAGEGLMSVDRHGIVVYANEVARRLLGLSEQETVGAHCCDLLCQEPSPADHLNCPFTKSLQDGETRQGTRRLLAGYEKTPLVYKYVCSPLAEDGLVSGCVILFSEHVMHDTVEGHSATDVFLDQALEAVMVTDAGGFIRSVNRAFTAITGFPASEAIGATPRLIKSGVHTPHFYTELWKALGNNGRWAGEIWNRRRNGEIYPQWGSISAVLDNDGKVKNYVAVFSDISKAKQAEEKLYHLANHDTLTDLPNRLNFSDDLTHMVERCKRSDSGGAVVFLDLDRFKIINDTLGHSVGDQYLKQIADRLLAASRRQDLLGRWGGDEFVLAMQDLTDQTQITDVLARMQQQLTEPIYLSGHELIPSASIGVAIFPRDGKTCADLIKAADTAMYRAKERGRNSVEFYAEGMTENLDTKLVLSSELHHAFAGEQFFLVYQPQVDPNTLALKGVEALARWRHPVRGVLAPGEFLATLDEFGLMEKLGQFALTEACRQMRQWHAEGVYVPKMSVNVAPSQLKESFIATVAQALRISGIAPQQLELEITEGALESGEVARKITRGLRELGVLVAVDDFGTGYSSLAHIKLFPITCFKIDKSFVDGLPDNADDVAIARTILALGSSFKVEIVAEGAETQAQVDFLRAEGVTNIQGYYFARPMEPVPLLEWLHSVPGRGAMPRP